MLYGHGYHSLGALTSSGLLVVSVCDISLIASGYLIVSSYLILLFLIATIIYAHSHVVLPLFSRFHFCFLQHFLTRLPVRPMNLRVGSGQVIKQMLKTQTNPTRIAHLALVSFFILFYALLGLICYNLVQVNVNALSIVFMHFYIVVQ